MLLPVQMACRKLFANCIAMASAAARLHAFIADAASSAADAVLQLDDAACVVLLPLALLKVLCPAGCISCARRRASRRWKDACSKLDVDVAALSSEARLLVVDMHLLCLV